MATDKKPSKRIELRDKLRAAAMQTLKTEGWRVVPSDDTRKPSMWRIEREGESHPITIRTSRDHTIAFPRTKGDDGWLTLDDVDFVIAATVDDPDDPTEAWIHMLPADEMRKRFDRALAVRKASGHGVKKTGRGLFLPLYRRDTGNWTVAGGGFGRDDAHPAIAKIPLDSVSLTDESTNPPAAAPATVTPPPPKGGASKDGAASSSGGEPVFVRAKRMIATELGVSESAIRIIIEA